MDNEWTIEALVKAILSTEYNPSFRILDLNKSQIELLVSGLKNKDEQIKKSSAKALSTYFNRLQGINHIPEVAYLRMEMFLQDENHYIIEQFLNALDDDDVEIRREVVSVISYISHPKALNSLISLLEDPDTIVRRDAALALGHIGSRLATNSLVRRLPYVDEVLSGAVVALGDIGDPDAVEPLIELLDQLNRKNYRIVESLGKIASADTAALNILIRRLETPDPQELMSIIVALGIAQNRLAVEPLLKFVKYYDFDVMTVTAEVLGHLGDPRATEALINVLEERLVSYPALYKLIHNIVEALGSIGDDRAIEALINLLDGEEGGIRYEASIALARTNGVKGIPVKISFLNSENGDLWQPSYDSLKEMGQASVPALIDALKHQESYIRYSAANLLGEIRDSRALEPLRTVLNNEKEEENVRDAAHRAIFVLRKGGIFISHRSDGWNTHEIAERIYERLVNHFGRELIFKNNTSISSDRELADFAPIIAQCSALIVIIEPNESYPGQLSFLSWVETENAKSELESSLVKHTPVIPILINGATLPVQDQQPDLPKPIIWQNPIEVTDAQNIDMAMDTLINRLERLFK